MKWFVAPLFFLSVELAPAQIFADISTTLGDFSVELDYINAPITVANFIILAEGSRPWVDSSTNQVISNTPYYEGITFHRVIDEFVIQAGSQNGLGTDGPGYIFPDEVENGLGFDVPFLLAMANSGPNSNGSQFFITENTPTGLNGIHTIFGSVSAGEDVVEAIHATPVSGNDVPTTDVVINSLIIRREGVSAQSFDEFEQELPVVSEVNLEGPEIAADGTTLITGQPLGSTALVERGSDLVTWSSESYFLDRSNEATQSEILTREFFRLPIPTTLVTWPVSAPAPGTYRGRTLTFTTSGNTLVLAINTLENSALGTLTIDGIESPITELREEFTNPYGASLLVFSTGFAPIRFELGADSNTGGRTNLTVFTLAPQSLSGSYVLAMP